MPDPVVDPSAGNPPGSADGAGNQQQDWRSSLPEELRGEKSLSSFKDVGGLAKSFVEGQKLIGSSIRLPGADAKPEEWGAFYDKLGRPAAPDKYEFKVPEAITAGFAPLRTGFQKVLHENGVSSKAAQAILDWYGNSYQESQGDLRAMREKTETELKEKWGGAYDKHMGLANRVVIEMGGQELVKYLDDTGLGNHPALIRTFAKVGALLAEDGAILTDGDTVPTASDAQAKIDAIFNNKDHPYHSRKKAGHKEAVEEVSKLFDLIATEA